MADGATNAEAQELVAAALVTRTAHFDHPHGLVENSKKRQLWAGGQWVEHLGLIAQLSSHEETAPPCRLRRGWEAIIDVTRRLALMPGSANGWEKVAALCILPRIHWAVPHIEPVLVEA